LNVVLNICNYRIKAILFYQDRQCTVRVTWQCTVHATWQCTVHVTWQCTVRTT